VEHATRREIVLGLSLIREADTAAQLLAVGLNQITDSAWLASEPAAAFTCLSSGVERLLKLTYGFDLVHRGQAFPENKELRRLGHDLVALQGIVHPRLGQSADALGRSYVASLLAKSSDDPYWPRLLAILNAWAATSGRYRDLTILSGQPMETDAPVHEWEALEHDCLTDLGLMSALAGPDNRAALVEARTRLARSALTWWTALFRAWTHGLLGTERVSAGTALSPIASRHLAVPLVDLVRAL
jgi:hypothetical protein